LHVRLAHPSDENAVVELARIDVAETLPHLDFDESITRATFHRYLEQADPTIFVAVDDGVVIGFLMALMQGYAFTSGLFTVQEVLFVSPVKRGTRAATLLMREFTRWSDQLGARENIGGNSNKFRSERTSRFLSHFGFEQVGYSMKRVPRSQ
jgi:L-amino acid N-acyltransferase YncA